MNWIKYGFETFAIFIGILAAVRVDSVNELRKERKYEAEYLANLKVDPSQQTGISWQNSQPSCQFSH